MRIVFMGTPDYALECLRAVYNNPNANIVGVLTQPDKPKGRGMKMIPPPVKVFAEEKGIPVYQPVTLKDGVFSEELEKLDPELIIVAAYGKILPKYVLDYPKYGCVNAHASILPRHRGSAPINRAIMEGDTKTGVCAMFMDVGLDTGDIIFTSETAITEEDDVGTLHDRLALMAGEAMSRIVDMAVAGPLPRTPQSEDGMTYAAKITKADCVIDFSRPPREILCLIRGLSPMPCAMAKTPDGKLLKITSAHLVNGECSAPFGTVLSTDNGEITVSCGGGKLAFTGVIPEGKSRMSAADYIRGRKLSAGDVLL